MELTGDLLIGAPREKVWQALNDPVMLARCIPGCEEVQRLSDQEMQARVLLKMGPVRARFVGKILMSEVQENVGCKLNFEGSGGAAGFARGNSTVTLADEAGGTRLRYSAQASVGGKLGQIGGRMIDASAKQMADQFFNALQKQLGTPAPTAPTAAVGGSATGTMAAPVTALTPAAIAPAVSPVIAPLGTTANSTGIGGEGVRILWFAMGAAATGFGVWLASSLN